MMRLFGRALELQILFFIQGTGVGLNWNFGGGLAGTFLVEFSGIVSMEAVLNFAEVVEIEFAGAVKLGSYILYHVNNVCSGLMIMRVYMLSLVGGEEFRCH
ncbi:unnamed protein product, partial [Brassica rapa subsp. narinosa]